MFGLELVLIEKNVSGKLDLKYVRLKLILIFLSNCGVFQFVWVAYLR